MSCSGCWLFSEHRMLALRHSGLIRVLYPTLCLGFPLQCHLPLQGKPCEARSPSSRFANKKV